MHERSWKRTGHLIAVVAAAPASGQLSFQIHVVAPSADQVLSVHSGDIDGDGDRDVVSANLATNEVAWYESTPEAYSPPGFFEHVIATNRRSSSFVIAVDMNGDDRVDIVSSSINDDKIAWYENLGGSPPSFAEHVVTADPNLDPAVPPEGFADAVRMFDLADFDGDGDLDVCSASVDDDKVAWFENPGLPDGTWAPTALTESLDGARAVHAADVDGDGDPDIVAGGWYDAELLWFENLGGAPPVFAEHVAVTLPPGNIPEWPGQVWQIDSGDPDADGDLDLVAIRFSETLDWYENDGGSPPAFSMHVVDATLVTATSVDMADLDHDGDDDILAAVNGTDEVTWHENIGGSPPVFVEHVITAAPSGLADGARSVVAADLDGDGDRDVLWGARGNNRIGWHESDLIDPLDGEPGSRRRSPAPKERPMRGRIAMMGLVAAVATPPATVGAGECTVFTSRSEFEAFNDAQGKVLGGIEDLEFPVSNVPPTLIVPLPFDPLLNGVPNVNTGGVGFPNGLALPVVQIQSNLSGPGAQAPLLGGGLVAVGEGALSPGVPNSVVVGANVFANSTDIILTPLLLNTSIGLDVIDPVAASIGGSVLVTVFNLSDNQVAQVSLNASEAKSFFGVSCPAGIGRINLAGVGPGGEGGGELVDNIEVWNASCAADLDGDDIVGITDLLLLLAAWGPAKDDPADFDGDGVVGITDLLDLLANWGPCP
jgi:hypothetical protein